MEQFLLLRHCWLVSDSPISTCDEYKPEPDALTDTNQLNDFII